MFSNRVKIRKTFLGFVRAVVALPLTTITFLSDVHNSILLWCLMGGLVGPQNSKNGRSEGCDVTGMLFQDCV